MNTVSSYIFPFVMAVAFHALIVAALVLKWEHAAPLVTHVEPYYIEAAMVSENPFKAKARQEAKKVAAAQARRDEVVQKRAYEDKLSRLAREKREREKQEQLVKTQKEEAKRLSSPAAPVASPVPTTEPEATAPEMSEADRVRMEQSLALAVMDEQAYRLAVTDDEKAMAYVAQIKRDIVQNWSRPPSARNGMQALLKVRLVPTGEVVDVTVVETSGNNAFDRSAVLAVEKAERFVVPTDGRQFERNFREFEVLFRPEDLRL